MPVFFYSENITLPKINKSRTKNWIKNIIEKEGCIQGNINIIFTNNEYLLEINKKYLSHNYYTDIITFDYSENKTLSGDLFISIEMIKENAIKYQTKLSDEINRVIIHGILHLAGYSDKTKEQKTIMRKKEENSMQLF